MAKNKTIVTKVKVIDFINSFVDDENKKQDSLQLIKLMQDWTGFKAKMWGPSIIGFGSYHYIYESGHEGDAPMIGFSPRKAAFSLYVYSETKANKQLLTGLGKFKLSKGCIYIKSSQTLTFQLWKVFVKLRLNIWKNIMHVLVGKNKIIS